MNGFSHGLVMILFLQNQFASAESMALVAMQQR
jgi:hypothetical protein